MTDEQKAAYVFAQAVSALAEIEGMKALNMQRQTQGYSMAYDDEAFFKVPDKYGLGHNAVMSLFHDIPQGRTP